MGSSLLGVVGWKRVFNPPIYLHTYTYIIYEGRVTLNIEITTSIDDLQS